VPLRARCRRSGPNMANRSRLWAIGVLLFLRNAVRMLQSGRSAKVCWLNGGIGPQCDVPELDIRCPLRVSRTMPDIRSAFPQRARCCWSAKAPRRYSKNGNGPTVALGPAGAPSRRHSAQGCWGFLEFGDGRRWSHGAIGQWDRNPSLSGSRT